MARTRGYSSICRLLLL
uniref:Uncharacterized protein n=1 Tax=Lepeophtheirus salmonis TaxID=72036 RepID=A0A0K2TAU5_LEPSM